MANQHTVTAITDNLSQLITNLNQTAKDAGGTDRLTTTQDSDIVGAINELDAEIGSVTLTTTAQTLTGAIQEIFQGGFEELDLTLDSVKTSTGLALGGFTDSERSSLGKALNALSRDIQILDSDMVGLLGRDSGDSGRAINLLTTTAKTIVGGINELDAEIGTLSSLTTGDKSSIVASINDIDSDVGALTSLSSEVRDSNIVSTINTLNTKVNNRNRFVEFFTDSAVGGDSAGSRIVADSANDFVKFSGGTNLEVVVEDSDNARTIKVNHTSVGASSVDNSGNTVIQDLTIDANGHVTGTASTTITSANNAQHVMGAQGGLLVNTPGGVNFTANAGTNITTNYSLDSDLRGNVKFAGQTTEYVHFSDSNGGQINFHNSGTRRFVMEDDGDFHAANDIIAFSTTPSDMRLKSDIEPITDALAKVNALTGYTFTYDHAGRKSAGLLAQEVEQVLPSAVSNKRLPLGANNNEEYKTLQYDQTIALLVESVKELKSEIDILKRDK
tara:strand:- start:4407 stop:5909 length:1503 start_codon:yes stop_codon:yes gene_type:complete